jgi:hypothetical protein
VEKSERDSDIEEEQTESIDLKHRHKRRVGRVQESIAAGLPRIQYLMPSCSMLACFTYKDL